MHCLLSEWEVLSFTNMLLMEVNMLPCQRQAAVCLGGKWIPIMHLQQHREAEETQVVLSRMNVILTYNYYLVVVNHLKGFHFDTDQ